MWVYAHKQTIVGKGVYGPAFKPHLQWEGCERKCHGQNPALAGEIRPSGIARGLAETLVTVELGPTARTERVHAENSPPKAERAVLLPGPLPVSSREIVNPAMCAL